MRFDCAYQLNCSGTVCHSYLIHRLKLVQAYTPNEYTRALLEEERKLMREITTGRMSWKKIGKMITLNGLLRSHSRPY